MKKLLIMVLASISVSAIPVTAVMAAETSANVAVMSNYVSRGQTQTKDSAAVQAGYDIKQSNNDIGWYANVFASTVSSGLEIDLSGGWKGAINKQGNIGYDVGGILYNYTDSQFSNNVTELFAGINYETAYAKLFMGSGSGISNYTYLDLGASFVFMQDLDLDLHYGRSSLTSSNDISASLGTELKGFNLALEVTYEDAAPTSEIEFFVTVKKEFDL